MVRADTDHRNHAALGHARVGQTTTARMKGMQELIFAGQSRALKEK
jgi:hypothetical protein